jgi:hypothetical protein
MAPRCFDRQDFGTSAGSSGLNLTPIFRALERGRNGRLWPEPEATLAGGGVRCLSFPLSSTAGTAETFSTRSSVKLVVDRAEERAGPEDVGDQALMRGLVTAFPFVRPGLSQPGVGRRSCDRPRRQLGSSPCRGPALATARLCLARCPVRGLKRRGCGPAEPSGLERSIVPDHLTSIDLP